jgi:hypothetical protein
MLAEVPERRSGRICRDDGPDRYRDPVARFVLFTWGLVAGWGWLLFGVRTPGAAFAGAALLGAATLIGAAFMVRRARRLRGGHEYVNARLEYHAGNSSRVWRRARPARDDDGGSELTLGGGW